MKTSDGLAFPDYIFILAIIVGQLTIFSFIEPRDSAYSWPGIFFPNAWLLVGSLAWYRLNPPENIRLSYDYPPVFIQILSVLLSYIFLFQLFFVPITLYAKSPFDLHKFLYLSSIVPLSEELFFRGLFFHTLIRDLKNVHVAALFVSFFFAFFHLPQGLEVVGYMFFLSVALCYLTALTKGIICGILVHVCLNALYYNKLLLTPYERGTFSFLIICAICWVGWKTAFMRQRNAAARRTIL